MSKNNYFDKAHLLAFVSLFISIVLVLSPLAWIVLRNANNAHDTIPTTPSVTTPEETTPQNTTPESTTPEETTPEETTTPQEEVVVPPALSAENVLNRICVTSGESESEIFAAKELTSYLSKKGITADASGFPISVYIDETLGTECFSVDATVSGENIGMTIVGGDGHGVLYGVYKFLEEYAGVRYFMPDLEKIYDGDVVLKDGNLLSYTPYFESRRLNWNCVTKSAMWCTKQGINGHDGILTSDKFGGKEVFAQGLFVHTIGKLSETGGGTSPNPCLSDPAIFETVIKNLRIALEKDPTVNIVSVSQNDSDDRCECATCGAVEREEGSPAGLMLRFVNRVAETLEADYPNLTFETLAYGYTQPAPKITTPRHNVCVRVCSIRCCFMHPLTECPDAPGPNGDTWTRTATFIKDLEAWGKICNRIYIWDYTTNYRYYVPTFANFGALRENMRFYHENGARGMFTQGNSESVSGEFGELRAYLLAKLMWNPYMTEEEYYRHMDEFLEAYYGEGWEYIRKYIDKTTELASDGCMFIYESPFEGITEQEYRANEEDFEAWWSAAEELAGNRARYVRRSRLQWRYIKLLLHPNEVDEAALYSDITFYNIRWAESNAYNYPPRKLFPSYFS